MNAKQVLSKIANMLNLADDTVVAEFTDAKTADGTILQSPTFDLNEDVEVVSEDGTKSPAPDGEHEISLKDSEGNENIIRIVTKDGKIVERENVEEEKNEEEMEGEMPADVTMEGETTDQTSTIGGKVNMAKDFVEAPKGTSSKEPAHALPNTTDEDPRNRVGPDTDDKKDPIISLSYRIAELETMLADVKMAIGDLTDRKDISHKEAQTTSIESDIKLAEEEEIDVPKLDGAPVEMDRVNLSALHKPNNTKQGNYQGSFLSKLYK